MITKQTSISLALATAAAVLAFWIGTAYQRLQQVETTTGNHITLIDSLADIATDNKRRLDLLEARRPNQP